MTKFYFAALLIQIIVIPGLAKTRADSLFTQLNQTLARKQEYVNAKLERLHQLHQELNERSLNDEGRFKILQNLQALFFQIVVYFFSHGLACSLPVLPCLRLCSFLRGSLKVPLEENLVFVRHR